MRGTASAAEAILDGVSQNPWGQAPPPDSNAGGYGQPAYGGPTQPDYGAGGPGAPGGYGAPPPPRRKSGLLVGLLVGGAVLAVVVVLVVVTLVLAGDDSGSTTAGSDPSSSGSSESSGSASGSEDPSPTEETSAPVATGADLAGNGYVYPLPGDSWQDATQEALDSGTDLGTIDSIAILGSSMALAQSNILVEVAPAGDASQPEDVEAVWLRNLAGTDGATPRDIEGRTIDGERALGIRIDDRVNTNGATLNQIAYLVLHDGQQFSIALTYPASGDNVSEQDFDAALSGWSWTS